MRENSEERRQYGENEIEDGHDGRGGGDEKHGGRETAPRCREAKGGPTKRAHHTALLGSASRGVEWLVAGDGASPLATRPAASGSL